MYAIQIFYIFPRFSLLGMSMNDLHGGLIIPIAVTGMIVSFILTRQEKIRSALLILFLCTCLVIPLNALMTSWRDRGIIRLTYQRFSPFEEFSTYIHPQTDSRVYISPQIYLRDRMLSQDDSSAQEVFNLYFRTNLPISQISGKPFTLESLQSSRFDYAFLQVNDWMGLELPQQQVLLNQYKEMISEDGKVVFLIKNSR